MPSNSKEYLRRPGVYERFWGKPEQIKARSLRNRARAIMVKKGLVKKGDKTMEVDHIKSTKAGNGPANLRVISRLRNRIDGQKKATKSYHKNNS